MKQVLAVFKREFAAYFATPLAYVFIVIYLFAMGAFTFYVGRFYDNGIADPDIKKPNACAGVTLPAATLGPHAAALGMRFYTGSMFPAAYKNTAFIARRGSWNRTKKFGYDVVQAKINGGKATITPFLTGFLDPATDAFWGRPVDVLGMPDGALLVSDDLGGRIYRISYKK